MADPIEIDEQALAIAAAVLGTATVEATVDAALREVGERLMRIRVLARPGDASASGG
ncbi:DUF2191 domain-containing protein [Nocardia tengchongensis]|uniref:DUF2191 domain-containing protein n=1 Tax=Nocardia tengchongensis TaxID=2055889 RepID=UPI0036802BF2